MSGGVRLILGDCLAVLPTLEAGSADAVVTDPPAGIGFMGKGWDRFGSRANPNTERDRNAANRGPGAGLGNQPFGYSGSALPKGPGERERFVAFLAPRLAAARRVARPGAYLLCWAIPRTSHWTGLAVEEAGWVIRDRISHLFGQGFPKAKSCLKPACEDWWLAWNPAAKVTPLNIDACRVGTADTTRDVRGGTGNPEMWRTGNGGDFRSGSTAGRYPANVVHDGSEEVLAGFPITSSNSGTPFKSQKAGQNTYGKYNPHEYEGFYGDSGTAARFFYCAKATKADRGVGNTHPTVKPQTLMRWLVRLITPPGGTVLDPFMGSGTTGIACLAEGFDFVGVEQNPEYRATAERRLAAARAAAPLFA